MKRWIWMPVLFILLFCGCGQEDSLRVGAEVGMTARLVPIEDAEPKLYTRADRDKPFVRDFHGQIQLVSVQKWASDTILPNAGKSCKVCGKGVVQPEGVLDSRWLGVETVRCPDGTHDGLDMRMERHDWRGYQCSVCDFGYEELWIYEVVNCYADSDKKLLGG